LRPKGGRPPIEDRAALAGILFVLKPRFPGCRWLPHHQAEGTRLIAATLVIRLVHESGSLASMGHAASGLPV
jgi:hypothetical protein